MTEDLVPEAWEAIPEPLPCTCVLEIIDEGNERLPRQRLFRTAGCPVHA